MYAALTSVTSQLEIIWISGKIHEDFSYAPAISFAGQGLAELSGSFLQLFNRCLMQEMKRDEELARIHPE